MCCIINTNYKVEDGDRYKFFQRGGIIIDEEGCVYGLLSPYYGAFYQLGKERVETHAGYYESQSGSHVFASLEDALKAFRKSRSCSGVLASIPDLVLVRCEVNDFVAGGVDESFTNCATEVWKCCKPVEIVPHEPLVKTLQL